VLVDGTLCDQPFRSVEDFCRENANPPFMRDWLLKVTAHGLPTQNKTDFNAKRIGFLIELHCVLKSGVALLQYY